MPATPATSKPPSVFCVEGQAYHRLVRFLDLLGLDQAPQNNIVDANLFVIDRPASPEHFTLISAAAEMGKRVCVINTDLSGVDGDGIEWFNSLDAFELFLRDEFRAARREAVLA